MNGGCTTKASPTIILALNNRYIITRMLHQIFKYYNKVMNPAG